MTEPKPGHIAAAFPVGGPYSGADTTAAGAALAELVRYLAHATRHAEALPEPQDAARLLGDLSTALAGLPQVLDQVARRLVGIRPVLGSTEDDPGTVLRTMAGEMAMARLRLANAAADLDRARQGADTLYVAEEGPDGERG
jgi:hypothetical protein